MTRIDRIELFPISIAYDHPEVSAQVNRGGVSDVVLRLSTSDGAVGWGECCSGADIHSVTAAARAMEPFVLGRSPWELDAMRRDVYWDGLWQFRKGTANFAWAGYEMALMDIQGKLAGRPVYELLGGKMRDSVDYFYYLSQGPAASLVEQCQDSLAKGFHVFYLKVGLDMDKELAMVKAIRDTIGPGNKIRLDANTAWTLPQAKKNLSRLEEYDIEFLEGPVVADVEAMNELKRHQFSIGLCLNEGLWTREEVLRHISSLSADYLNYSPYWVGSFFDFKCLSSLAAMKGIPTCKHTHGEFSISAMANHHALLNLPSITDGNQQTAYLMRDDIVDGGIPIQNGPSWGIPQGSGLCLSVDEDKLHFYAKQFETTGQFLPYGER